MRREERVTVQGPVKEQQPDGMSHRGGFGLLLPASQKPRLGAPHVPMDHAVGGPGTSLPVRMGKCSSVHTGGGGGGAGSGAYTPTARVSAVRRDFTAEGAANRQRVDTDPPPHGRSKDCFMNKGTSAQPLPSAPPPPPVRQWHTPVGRSVYGPSWQPPCVCLCGCVARAVSPGRSKGCVGGGLAQNMPKGVGVGLGVKAVTIYLRERGVCPPPPGTVVMYPAPPRGHTVRCARAVPAPCHKLAILDPFPDGQGDTGTVVFPYEGRTRFFGGKPR